MRTIACIIILSIMLAGCSNTQQEQQLKALATKDSLLLLQTQQKDSAINSYVHSLNAIQDNLDSIKKKERILTLGSGEGISASPNTIAEIKSLDKLIVKNHREIYSLEKRLKKSIEKNSDLEKMVARLTKELTEKDEQIVDLENKLAKANDSLKLVVTQLKDSIVVINRQRSEINAMRGEINTVYYAIGTMKELKSNGVVTKEGGFIGIGRTASLKQDFNVSYFTEGNLMQLKAIPLNAKFSKLLTNHPSDSYKISGNNKADSLYINNAVSFWSESKYLVIIVK